MSNVHEGPVVFAFPSINKTEIIFQNNPLVNILEKCLESVMSTNVQKYYTHILENGSTTFGNNQMFSCRSGELLSRTVLHNRVKDCVDGSDESGLKCYHQGRLLSTKLCLTNCVKAKCTCVDLYFHSIHGGCFPYNYETRNVSFTVKALVEPMNEQFLHHDFAAQFALNHTLSKRQQRDEQEWVMTADCTESEIETSRERRMGKFTTDCLGDDHMQCTYGCKRCFPIYKVCVHELDTNYSLMHCPSGAHLKNCLGVDCNNMFKCPKRYCVPYRYKLKIHSYFYLVHTTRILHHFVLFCSIFRHLCDRLWHCPLGEDEDAESCSKHMSCSALFKCVMQTNKVCLHPVEICNGVQECASGEDEYLCELPNACHPHCTCLLFAITCKKATMIDAKHLMKYTRRMLFSKLIEVCFLKNYDAYSYYIDQHALILIWKKSKIEMMCGKFNFTSNSLVFVDFSENMIENLSNSCFGRADKLLFVILKSNNISSLHPSFLGNNRTKQIVLLDVSNNFLKVLSVDVFGKVSTCVLNVTSNPFSTFDENMRTDARVSAIVTNDHRICCLMNSSVALCNANVEWPQNCNSLLQTSSCRIVTCISLSLILLINFLALFFVIDEYRSSTKLQVAFVGGVKIARKSTISPAYVVTRGALHCNDLLASLCLCFILSNDTKFGEQFFVFHTDFVTSTNCYIFGFLDLLHKAMSLFLINFLSLSRMIVTKYPFESFFKETRNIVKSCGSAVLCIFSICFLVPVVHQHIESLAAMPSALCSFTRQFSSSVTVFVTTLAVCALQIGSICSVFTCYCIIIAAKHKPGPTATVDSKQKPGKGFHLQIILILSTVCLCWLTSGIISIVSMAADKFPMQLLIWDTVMVNPINSLMHPLVLTVWPFLKTSVNSQGDGN